MYQSTIAYRHNRAECVTVWAIGVCIVYANMCVHVLMCMHASSWWPFCLHYKFYVYVDLYQGDTSIGNHRMGWEGSWANNTLNNYWCEFDISVLLSQECSKGWNA